MTASDGAVDKHLAKGQEAAADNSQGQPEAAKGQAEAAKDNETEDSSKCPGDSSKGPQDDSKGPKELSEVTGDSSKGTPREEPMSLKDEAKLDLESEEMERKCSASTASGWSNSNSQQKRRNLI